MQSMLNRKIKLSDMVVYTTVRIQAGKA